MAILLLWQSPSLHAQQFYQPLDTLDQNLFLVGIAANILPDDRIELLQYSTLNSFWLAFHQFGDGSPVLDRFRSTTFISSLEAYYGVSGSQRWDIGLRLRYMRTRLDNDARSPLTEVFRSSADVPPPDGRDHNFSGLVGAGLRVRIMPISSIPSLTINAGYSISNVKSEVEREALHAERDIADLAVTYYTDISPNVYYYFIATAAAYLPAKMVNEQALYAASGNFFLVHISTSRKWVFYPGLSYNITFKPPQLRDDWLIRQDDLLLAMAGMQFQPTTSFHINASIGYPLFINNTNPNFKQVRSSYSLWNLGFRLLL